jgi:Indole-3-glycerol phosphate synthase
VRRVILEQILADTRARVARLPRVFPDPAPRQRRSLVQAIRSPSDTDRILGELKFSSPSRGRLQDPALAGRLATELVAGGCVALSVVTEPSHFGGNLEVLSLVRERVTVPVLRKDFILDARQVYETRAIGADAILLIARILGDKLPGFVSLARSLGLEPLVEVHTPADLAQALACGADLIGINNRDLGTLEVDLSTTERLAPRCDGITTRIAMSGISSRSDIDRLRGSVEAFLIGTALMSSSNPRATLEELRCG